MTIWSNSSGKFKSNWFAEGGNSVSIHSSIGQARLYTVPGRNTTRWGADIASRRVAQRNADAAYNAAINNQALNKRNTQSRIASSFGATQFREAATRAGAIAAAAAANAGASLRASEATSQSGRLFTEFEARLAQQRALRQRDLDRAVGQSTAGFGAAGIQSTGAVRDIERESALRGAISESQANQQRLAIIGQGRAGVTDAIASSVSTGGRLLSSLVGSFGREVGALGQARDAFRSSQVQNQIARREVSQVSGITPDIAGAALISTTGFGPVF